MSLKIAATGFVDDTGGSVTSANAIFLRGLLDNGIEVHFFSKPSFVDPRPSAPGRSNLRFHDTTNVFFDNLRRKLSKFPVIRSLAVRLDASTYDKLLVKRITQAHQIENFDLCLWMGIYAPGRVPDLKTVCFAQGPPGTDARSLIERQDEIAALAGSRTAKRWAFLAKLRLSKMGLPNFDNADHIIVGSSQSASSLHKLFAQPKEKVSALPYPIDLRTFHLPDADFLASDKAPDPSELKVLWLGRIVPRKRLDVFLKGCEIAIKRGVPLRVTIVGQTALIPEYEKLIENFSFPERLEWHRKMPRAEITELMWRHDVLGQPSDEEDFGSSIAEAQACGLPAIVGVTNGNADYLCPRSIHLKDDGYETFADALELLYNRKANGEWGDPAVSRQTAEKFFTPEIIVQRLLEVLNTAHSSNEPSK